MGSQSKFVLYEEQLPHVERLRNIHRNWFTAFDFSPAGTGKTLTGLRCSELYSEDMGFDHNRAVVITILPIIDSNWVPTSEFFSFSCLKTIGYEKLRGTFTRGCNNEFVTRDGDDFAVTTAFQKFLNEGIFIIVDEYQRLKNVETAQARAMHAIVRAAKGTPSKVLFLSATPFCHRQEVESTLRLAGILTVPQVIEYVDTLGRYKQDGIDEVREFCSEIDHKLTVKHCPAVVTKKNVTEVLYNLFIKIVHPYLVSMMPKLKIAVKITSRYEFVKMNEKNTRTLVQAAETLRKKLAMCKAQNNTTGMYEALNTHAITSERTKLEDYVEKIRQRLHDDPNGKVLAPFRLHDTIHRAHELLSEEFPNQVAILNGETKSEERVRIIREYQEGNLRLRCILFHPTVGGVGISLDDRFGTFRRYIVALPTHYIIDEIQYLCRPYRITSKSDVEAVFLLSAGVEYELQLIHSACEKLEVLSDLTDPEYLEMIFPKAIINAN